MRDLLVMRRLRAVAGVTATLLLAPRAHAQDDLSRWRYFRPIKVDTSASGAKVKADVKGFPVAVGLGAANFDFSQANPDGSDLRVSHAGEGGRSETPGGGRPLPYSIESWDKAGQTAAVWVKLDVVKGNNKTQQFF